MDQQELWHDSLAGALCAGLHVVPGYLAQRYGYELHVVTAEEQRHDLMETIVQQQALLADSLKRLEALS